ncbi:outer membrane protein OmpU [Paraburkholderia fungorum]|uniref:Outer membrane protein OmpU n=1 Tax=Paraburkholderia fungorum TaxID=134537 RepID=A0A1H1JN19_9BURK|nr:porin [Paraburkholderia fungorum]SDR51089.1 outer membrane protein OmpU [Paraburkholderia fungorum]
MKKYLTGFAMLIAVSSAHAQSSVTLYGLIDAGFTYINNQGGGKLYEFQDGANFGNRFGFKGSEDLGGGLKAVFQLENGFSLGTGQLRNNGALFGRQAFVALQSNYGTLTMGNQYDFIADYITPFNLNGYASVYAGHMGDIDRISAVELPNSVKYQSPTFGGLSFGGMWSFGNVAGNFRQDSAYSLGLSYKNGGFNTAAIYERIHDVEIYPYAQFGVFNFLGQTVATHNADGSVNDLFYSSPFLVDTQSEFGIGASYTRGKLTLAANFTSTHLEASTGSDTMNVYEAGAMYFVAPDIAVLGGYQYTTWDHTHWHQPTLGAQYYLSKRTSFYVNVSYLHAQPGVNANQGAGFYSLPSSTNTQLTSRIAIIHQF